MFNGGKSKSAEEKVMTLKELRIQTLNRTRVIAFVLAILAMTTVLGFQLVYSFRTDIPWFLGVGSSVLIVLITIFLPHLMPGVSLLPKIPRWSIVSAIVLVAMAALVPSFEHMYTIFEKAGFGLGSVFLPGAFDATALMALMITLFTSTEKNKLEYSLDPRLEQAVLAPQINAEPMEPTYTAKEVTPPGKDAQKRSESPKPKPKGRVAPPKGTPAIESGELSENERKWLKLIEEVYEEGMSVAKVKEALKAKYDKSGNHNTITRLVRIIKTETGER